MLTGLLGCGAAARCGSPGGSMKLFSRFLRKAPPSAPTLQERIAILDAGSADLVVGTAFGADEEGLRMAAIQKLPHGDALYRLAGLSGPADGASVAVPAALERTARERIAQLIDAGSIDFARLCDEAGNRAAMLSVAALCKDAARLPQALASIADPLQVAQLVLESPYSRLRQLAAEAVTDPAQVRQLLKQIRSRDKSVYKILKQKSDALNAAERKAAEIAGEVGALCASLERHSHRPYDALYTPAFEIFYSRWRSLTVQPDSDVEQRALTAIDGCRQVIAQHARQMAQKAADEAAQQAARETRQRALQSAQEAASVQAETAEKLRREAAAIRDEEEKARVQKWAEEEELLRDLGARIRKANGALSGGNTQRAAGLRRAIEEKLPSAPALPNPLMRQLQQLDEKLDQLKKWKDYAVAPKRIELIAEMETLIGSTEHPQLLADRIKSLQQEWRTIGKGIVSDAPAEWERFHQASQAAYQPCREYFEAQAKMRQANLQKRKALLERLAAFELAQQGENLDWRLLASVLREAPQEWRRYFPVDREAGRAMQGAFAEAMAGLQARLDAWYERNVADKQSIIKRARYVLTQEDSREAIEAVRRLQSSWKEAGPAPHEQEQSLWSEFREVCDAVYQKRQQAYAEYTAGLEAAKVKAEALCEQVERLAALSGTVLHEGAAKIPEWRTAFEALDEMPRAEARALQDRFERAIDRCRAQVAQQQLLDAERSFTSLFEAGRHIQGYAWAVVRNAEASEREILKQAAENFIASVQHWPKGGLLAVKEILANAGSAFEADLEGNEKALRVLCIRCEIQSETPSPPEDAVLRREYQVQRLIEGMGQGNHADDSDWDAMALQWIRIGAVAPAAGESLQARFLRCRAARQAPRPRRLPFKTDDSADKRNHSENRAGKMRRPSREGTKTPTER